MVLKDFFVFEGIDGSGKSTQIELLKKSFKSKKVFFTSEPTKSPVGNLLREVLSGKKVLSNSALSFLFASDRAEHLYAQNGIIKNLEEGKIVVCDRYLFSTLAYQKSNGKNDFSHYANAIFPLPEKVFYFDLPVNEAISRMQKRKNVEIFENEKDLTQIKNNYDFIFDEFQKNNEKMQIIRIDATKKIDEIQKEIFSWISV